jgi:threonine dehydratase
MATPELQQLQPNTDLDLMADIFHAQAVLARPDSPVRPTEIFYDDVLSERYEADIWFASELHQVIGAYKMRGADYLIQSLAPEQQDKELVASSAGNWAQAIALRSRSHIFMPSNTPTQKVQAAIDHGGDTTEITLVGKTYDACEAAALEYCRTTGGVFAPPFNHRKVIAGHGTWGREIVEALPDLDTVFCPVGGGGLSAGVGTALLYHNPAIEFIGVEPAKAASMTSARYNGAPTRLADIDTFVDGAAVGQVGAIPFAIVNPLFSRVLTVAKRDVRRTTTELWNRDMRVELAGALALAGLEQVAPSLVGKKVLYLLTGGNLSAERFESEVRLTA